MRVSDPFGHDWDITPGTTTQEAAAAWGVTALWCGQTALTPEHPFGVPPLVHGAQLRTAPGPLSHLPSGPYLSMTQGPDAGALHPLTSPVTIGSSPQAQLRGEDPALSREHARVTDSDPPRITDLGSTNGIGTRWSPRRTWPTSGGVLLGNSLITAHGLTPPEDAPPRPPVTFPWTSLIGGIASGGIIAAMTGRWYLAFIGLALPLAMLLVELARRFRRPPPGTPLATIPDGPLAIRGEATWVHGYARAVMLQRGAALAGWNEPWTRWLTAPDHTGEAPVLHDVHLLSPSQQAPSWCTATIDVNAHACTTTTAHGTTTTHPWRVSAASADLLARRAASTQHTHALPTRVRWADIAAPPAAPSTPGRPGPRRMTPTVGMGQDGPVTLDLDHDGPHLLVAGTTGSGKSVFLDTLVSALALEHPPHDLSLALMDFKGGAGLHSCLALPHVTATVTDLDQHHASRALAGLAHELHQRKHHLAAAGFTSWKDWETHATAPPRLLVVIDEYQEISMRMRDFLPEIARIAAQGRSLGLHLILATQRPSGAVTPEVRANIGTTVVLRVASDGESRDLLGSVEAAHLPRSSPGRAIVSRPGGDTIMQTASPSALPSPALRRADSPIAPGPSLADRAHVRWSGRPRPPALWCPPLPETFSPQAGPPAQGPLTAALADAPDTRTQHHVDWTPGDGALLIVGPARTGRTSALAHLASQAHHQGLRPVTLPRNPREAARTLAIASTHPSVLLLIDEADAAITRLQGVDDGGAYEALLTRLSMRLPTAIAGTTALPSRLAHHAAVIAILDGADSTQASLWGAPRNTPTAHGTPGRGWVKWPGGVHRAQLATAQATSLTALSHRLVSPLPDGRPHQVWGIGGDHATAIDAPRGAVVVGPPSALRDAVQRSLGAGTRTFELATVVPTGTPAVLTAPRARDVRHLAHADSAGVVDPAPVEGRAVVITDGRAQAVQLGSLVWHVSDGVQHHGHQADQPHHDRDAREHRSITEQQHT